MVKVSVCSGMSCSMYGANDTLMTLQKELKRTGVCASGPCIRINGVKFRHVDPDSVAGLVQEEILPLING